MPTKVLLVNTLEQTVKEAQEMTPPGFELVVGAPGSAGLRRGARRIPST